MCSLCLVLFFVVCSTVQNNSEYKLRNLGNDFSSDARDDVSGAVHQDRRPSVFQMMQQPGNLSYIEVRTSRNSVTNHL